MSTNYYQYQPTTTLPVPVPGKQPQQQQPFVPRHTRNPSGYSQYSASPPERPESVTTGGGLYSSASSNYAGSDYDSSTGLMVVNTEWGSFDNELSVLPTTKYDVALDAASVNPGIQMFEKRVSGMFLGELLRLAIRSGLTANDLKAI